MVHAGILLAAPASGSGKTTITCALIEVLKRQNRKVRSFKSGPDYIDPMFHERVLHVPSRNLDTFFSDEEQLRQLYYEGVEETEFSIIEGAMGLYDGLGGTNEKGSAYHLAQVLDLPVLLVLDTHGMGRTMLPLLAGIKQYDTDGRIAGVILNRTSEGFFRKISGIIEEEIQLPVLGFFPQKRGFHLESRHLGLKLPEEIAGLRKQMEDAAIQLEKNVDIERILEIARQWSVNTHKLDIFMEEKIRKPQNTVRIAVAVDSAFCFYYEDNLRMLRQAGAELVPFSPLVDEILPENIDGILLGGGYPELCAKELSENVSMRNSIRQAIESGMPSLAECGGFMYLHDSMTVDGVVYPMAGVVKGNCTNTGKLVRFGYVEIMEYTPEFLPKGECIKGHEFHYYDSDYNGDFAVAKKPMEEKRWDCIHGGKNHWWGYPHLYYPSAPGFVEHFVKCANEWGKKGRLYGIGVGPGDPELMTLKALQTIRSCNLLVLPAVSKEECYAYRIARQVCPEMEKKSVICMPFPMTKDEKKMKMAHEQIYGQIEKALEKGMRVGLLTIGDPSVYSTYMYMHKRAKEAGWQAQMISGVPSFCAAAARLGISLGENTDEIHIVPASYEISETLSYTGTRVYMKSGKKLAELIALLQKDEQSRNCEIHGISNCGMEEERVYHGLEELKQAKDYLTVVIVKPQNGRKRGI